MPHIHVVSDSRWIWVQPWKTYSCKHSSPPACLPHPWPTPTAITPTTKKKNQHWPVLLQTYRNPAWLEVSRPPRKLLTAPRDVRRPPGKVFVECCYETGSDNSGKEGVNYSSNSCWTNEHPTVPVHWTRMMVWQTLDEGIKQHFVINILYDKPKVDLWNSKIHQCHTKPKVYPVPLLFPTPATFGLVGTTCADTVPAEANWLKTAIHLFNSCVSPGPPHTP